mmetsp:Transcript_30093/g.43756  ORF Transcript_30093/g.43756 Transcript_30093/m.43756 type:complete len:198 (-) Transcript_30093:1728-2321(-)
MLIHGKHTALVSILCFILLENVLVNSFLMPRISGAHFAKDHFLNLPTSGLEACSTTSLAPNSALFANSNDNDDASKIVMSEEDQVALGAAGTIASLITLYSESVLKSTGCGLPAGPFGLVGAMEGLSYLGVVGIASFSLYKKVKTGSGLPAGPGGILGGAEGLSFLAIAAGLIVLVLQITNYGYIPNAVPMEGGMCQ